MRAREETSLILADGDGTNPFGKSRKCSNPISRRRVPKDCCAVTGSSQQPSIDWTIGDGEISLRVPFELYELLP
jgi:hypothetical protein